MDKPGPRYITRNELLKQILEIRKEIRHRKDRLQENVFAGVNKNSIIAQKIRILELEAKEQSLNHKYQNE